VGSGDTKKAAATPASVTGDATNYKWESRIATTEATRAVGNDLFSRVVAWNPPCSWPSQVRTEIAEQATKGRVMVFLPVRNQEVVMSNIATTKLSSKGQVVIPEEIRERLGLKPGTQFVVLGDRDTVILKTISAPAMEQFDDLIAESHRAAKKAGLRQADITAAVKKVRGQG